MKLGRVGVLVGALLVIALTARLGWWQLDRARQKLDLQAAMDAELALPPLDNGALGGAGQLHRRVALTGQWLPQHTVWLDNRPMDGRAGFYVVTPLRLTGRGDVVLVQRGWAPRDAGDRTRVPAMPLAEGSARLEARIAIWPSHRLALSPAAESGPIRQNLDFAQLARDLGVALRPLSLQQLSAPEPADALQRDWPVPVQDVWKNQGYALQWFALCALIAGLALWYGWISPRRRGQEG